MFGTNEIVGQKFFKEAPKESLFVTSIFFTLQGEGPFAGRPAVFVRLTKCNLSCSFCDTFFDDGNWMTYHEIHDKISETIDKFWLDKGQLVPPWVYNVIKDHPEMGDMIDSTNVILVITGGEPLLQPNLTNFLKYQVGKFAEIQIESNGILNRELPESVTLVCSPKCTEKNGISTKYLEPTTTILERADCLKFVMSADKESPYSSVPGWAHEWKRNTGKEVYCSPMNIYNTLPQKIKVMHSIKGNITMDQRSTVDERINFFEHGLINMEAVAKNHEYVGHYCIQHGFKMNMQMHLFANLA